MAKNINALMFSGGSTKEVGIGSHLLNQGQYDPEAQISGFPFVYLGVLAEDSVKFSATPLPSTKTAQGSEIQHGYEVQYTIKSIEVDNYQLNLLEQLAKFDNVNLAVRGMNLSDYLIDENLYSLGVMIEGELSAKGKTVVTVTLRTILDSPYPFGDWPYNEYFDKHNLRLLEAFRLPLHDCLDFAFLPDVWSETTRVFSPYYGADPLGIIVHEDGNILDEALNIVGDGFSNINNADPNYCDIKDGHDFYVNAWLFIQEDEEDAEKVVFGKMRTSGGNRGWVVSVYRFEGDINYLVQLEDGVFIKGASAGTMEFPDQFENIGFHIKRGVGIDVYRNGAKVTTNTTDYIGLMTDMKHSAQFAVYYNGYMNPLVDTNHLGRTRVYNIPTGTRYADVEALSKAIYDKERGLYGV